LSLWVQLVRGLYEAAARIADDQPRGLKTPILEVLQEAAPAAGVFLLALGNPQDLPVAVGLNANRDQDRDVANLASPTALQDDAIEINVRELAFDRPVPPGLRIPR
jgi:hypothetical protein